MGCTPHRVEQGHNGLRWSRVRFRDRRKETALTNGPGASVTTRGEEAGFVGQRDRARERGGVTTRALLGRAVCEVGPACGRRGRKKREQATGKRKMGSWAGCLLILLPGRKRVRGRGRISFLFFPFFPGSIFKSIFKPFQKHLKLFWILDKTTHHNK